MLQQQLYDLTRAWATADAKATRHLHDAVAEPPHALLSEGAAALAGISRRYPAISQLSRLQLIITGLAAIPSLAIRRLLPLKRDARLKGGTSQSFK